MAEFKQGQTVYDNNAVEFEYGHAHNGVHFVHPIYGTTDEYGDYYEHVSDTLIGLATVYEKPPVKKISEKVMAELDKLSAIKSDIAAANTAMRESQAKLRDAERAMETWNERHGLLAMVARMLENPNDLFYLTLRPEKWAVPEGTTPRDVAALKLVWDSKNKAFRMVTKIRGILDGETTVTAFETKEELHAMVQAMFDTAVAAMRPIMAARPASVFDPRNSYSSPHINTLKQWVSKWAHLSIPEDILVAQEAYRKSEYEAKVEAAKKQLEALQANG